MQRFILNNSDYISTSPQLGRITPFSSIKTIAYAAYDSAHTASLRHAAVMNHENIICVGYEGTPVFTVDLAKWSKAAVKSMSKYQDSVIDILPPGISLTDFPFDHLSDKFSFAACCL